MNDSVYGIVVLSCLSGAEKPVRSRRKSAEGYSKNVQNDGKI